MSRPLLVVSACLLGYRTRYDGLIVRSDLVTDGVAVRGRCLPVCPEVDCGLSVPRAPMQLHQGAEGVRLRVLGDGPDHTARLTTWCAARLDELASLDIRGCVLKSRSPSCGLSRVPIFSAAGEQIREGMGLFASAFAERFPDVPYLEDDFLDGKAVDGITGDRRRGRPRTGA